MGLGAARISRMKLNCAAGMDLAHVSCFFEVVFFLEVIGRVIEKMAVEGKSLSGSFVLAREWPSMSQRSVSRGHDFLCAGTLINHAE